ncbi:13099_t:CDS:2 [Ambispora gerdemannii]|uniref:13099_t:CDS:1 n=1 Tax=Ambispora gerdemannii TaxID=144530 RepID=A0A9N8ZFI3_9GLOM|nr:13099_t:CDS:2 [Ambispora gerdemannii]
MAHIVAPMLLHIIQTSDTNFDPRILALQDYHLYSLRLPTFWNFESSPLWSVPNLPKKPTIK